MGARTSLMTLRLYLAHCFSMSTKQSGTRVLFFYNKKTIILENERNCDCSLKMILSFTLHLGNSQEQLAYYYRSYAGGMEKVMFAQVSVHRAGRTNGSLVNGCLFIPPPPPLSRTGGTSLEQKSEGLLRSGRYASHAFLLLIKNTFLSLQARTKFALHRTFFNR